MRTRREAVEHLQRRGLYAAERDWALGETVFVATGASVHKGITVYKRAMYIVPKGARWTTVELDHPGLDDGEELSLDEACACVERVLAAGPGC